MYRGNKNFFLNLSHYRSFLSPSPFIHAACDEWTLKDRNHSLLYAVHVGWSAIHLSCRGPYLLAHTTLLLRRSNLSAKGTPFITPWIHWWLEVFLHVLLLSPHSYVMQWMNCGYASFYLCDFEFLHATLNLQFFHFVLDRTWTLFFARFLYICRYELSFSCNFIWIIMNLVFHFHIVHIVQHSDICSLGVFFLYDSIWILIEW